MIQINISLEDNVSAMADELAKSSGLSKSDLISSLITKEVTVQENSRLYGYTWEKLHSSIHSLASDGKEGERIKGAYMGIHMLKRSDFPSELRDKYDALIAILEEYRDESKNGGTGSEGLFLFAARRMSEDERRKCRDVFISLYDSITRHMPLD